MNKKMRKIIVGISMLGIICTIKYNHNRHLVSLTQNEIDDNEILLLDNGISEYTNTIDNNTYNLKVVTDLNKDEAKNLSSEISNILHGTNTSELKKEYRNYDIKVNVIDENNNNHISYIKGHK